MKRIGFYTISILRKPLTILCLLLFFQLGMFLWTTVRPYTKNIPDRTYLIQRGHVIYTSFIRQSKEGAWGVYSPHTTRPTPVVYSHLFFVFLGKLAAIGNIDPLWMFMLSRVAAGIIIFFCTYWLIRIILPPKLHILAILFTLGIEPGPLITALSGNPTTWIPAVFSYYPQVVAYRHFGLPHHTLGEALGLLLFGLCILCVRRPTPKRLFILALVSIIDTLVLPPYPAILIVTVLIPWGFYSLFAKYWKKLIIPYVVIALMVGVVSLFTKQQISKGIPWTDFNIDEKRWVTNADTIINYISSILLSIPFIVLLWGSVIKLWKTWDSNTKFVVFVMSTWLLIPAALVPLSSFSWFPFANFRVMDGYDYVPAGILATLGLSILITSIKNHSLARIVQALCIGTVIITSCTLTYLYTARAFSDQDGLWSNVYIAKDHWQAFAFLDTVPKRSGVMVMNHFGEIIPDFASVRTYIGTTPGFSNWPELFFIASRFYSGEMTDEEAIKTLHNEDISYVYWSDEEKYYNKTGTLYPDLLTPVFTTPGVVIFKVNTQ
jgi:hypothetical protein